MGTGTYSDKLNRPLREAQASGHFLLNFSLTNKYSENVQSEYELLNKYKNKDKNYFSIHRNIGNSMGCHFLRSLCGLQY